MSIKTTLALNGETKEEAFRKDTCIECKRPITLHPSIYLDEKYKVSPPTKEEQFEGLVWTYAGKKEVRISGMCEYCFDKLFEDL